MYQPQKYYKSVRYQRVSPVRSKKKKIIFILDTSIVVEKWSNCSIVKFVGFLFQSQLTFQPFTGPLDGGKKSAMVPLEIIFLFLSFLPNKNRQKNSNETG